MTRPGSEPEVVDLFCGGGGTTAGMERALGRPVTVAVNHWKTAIEVHQKNHPGTRHHHCDVWHVAPVQAVGDRPVAALWASPDCTHHSVARGGKPRQQRLRTLPWAVVRWAAAVRPEVMFIENVPEFRKWGPLGKDKKPIKAREGETFRAWCRKLERLGYVVDHRVLCAADYGVPTSRRRLIIVARRDGLPVTWPEPTHGSKEACAANPKLHPYRTAAECIDFTLPCPSIFERKRPLAAKTLWRIAEGIRRFVLEHPEPFVIRTDMHQSNSACVYGTDDPLTTVTTARGHALVVPSIVGVGGRSGQAPPTSPAAPLGTVTGKNDRALVAPHLVKVNHGGRDPRGEQIDLPLSTVTATQRGHALVTPVLEASDRQQCDSIVPGGRMTWAAAEAFLDHARREEDAIVAPTLVQTSYGERPGQRPRYLDLHKPLGTVVAQGTKHALVAALLKHYGGVVGVPLDGRPLDTITAKDHHSLTAATLVKFRGTDGQPPAQDVREPLPTITASGNHVAEVRAFLTTYYGADGTGGQSLMEPMRTITAKHRLGLVTIHGVDYQIVDIGMRMLEPPELLRATCGPEFDLDLSPAETKEAQVKLVGNMVPPGLAAAVVRANLPASLRRAA
jgi:DNA (cytosine-5)-methyltransferase 1